MDLGTVVNLFILGEESLNKNSLEVVLICKWACGGNIEFNKQEYSINNIFHNGKVYYKIEGIRSAKYQNFYYVNINRAGNSFCDYLLYESEDMNPPLEDTIPFAAIEATKNNGNESGNMTAQRASKFIPIIEKWGNIKLAYLINNTGNILDTKKSFRQAHNCDFATMIALGVDILISHIGETEYSLYNPPFKYESLNDIVIQENNKRINNKYTPSRVIDVGNNSVLIQANLYKKNGPHDPNEGYVASRAYLIRKLEPNKEILIFNHNQTELYFNKKNNKLINVLKLVGVSAVFCDHILQVEKEENIFKNKKYWTYNCNGEKNASILAEVFLNNKGYTTIFSNHAGCEKSYISIGDNFYTTKKGKGIPDLVMLNEDTNDLLVIEAEKTENYAKGILQMLDPEMDKFIDREFVKRIPKKINIKKYICTYGSYNPNTHKTVLFNLTKCGQISYNENAVVVD